MKEVVGEGDRRKGRGRGCRRRRRRRAIMKENECIKGGGDHQEVEGDSENGGGDHGHAGDVFHFVELISLSWLLLPLLRFAVMIFVTDTLDVLVFVPSRRFLKISCYHCQHFVGLFS